MELTTRYVDDLYTEYCNTGKHELAQIYLKPETDKVIAELQEQIHEYVQGLYVLQAMTEKEVQHQKYKRCIGLWARLEMNCNWFENRLHNAIELGLESDVKRWTRKLHHAKRWRKRWLELARKLKEAK